jgi:integrase
VARKSRTGVRGLTKQTFHYDVETGDAIAAKRVDESVAAGRKVRSEERWSIDLRWEQIVDGRPMPRRYSKLLPADISSVLAKKIARDTLQRAFEGKLEKNSEKDAVPRTLYKALDEYLQWAETENEAETYRGKCSQAKQIKAVLSDRPLGEVAAFTLEQFKRDRGKMMVKGARAKHDKKTGKVIVPAQPDHPVGAQAVNRPLVLLKHLLRKACDWDWINLSAKQERSIHSVKLLKEPPPRDRHLSIEEEPRLLPALPCRIQRILTVALYTGMRREEVVPLKKTAVHFDRQEIDLDDTKNNESAKVAFSAEIAEVLREAIEESPAASPYVFTSPRRTKRGGDHHPYNLDAVTHAIIRARKKAGVDGFRFHDGRHTYATRSRRAGVPLDVLQKQLNHKSSRMTQRYAKVATEQQHEAVNRLIVTRIIASPLPDPPEVEVVNVKQSR